MPVIYRCGGHKRGVCSYESEVKWRHSCPGCGRYYDILIKSSMEEEKSKISFASLAVKEIKRIPTQLPEFDKVIGGGLVPGSTILLAGPPKVGKTTLMVTVAAGVGESVTTGYYSGEQSTDDIAVFVHRTKAQSDNVYLRGNYGDAYKIMEDAEEQKAKFIIVDSLQTASFDDVKADAGSSAQVKAVANGITEWAKQKKICVILLCHVNKEGEAGGPEFLKHIVDTIVYFEPAWELDDDGEMKIETENMRTLWSSANRNASGPGTFTSLFEMTEEGIKAIRKKSKLELV